MKPETLKDFIGLPLAVPAAWLRSEAQAARVPHLRIGRRMLFNPAAVERVLSRRANRDAKGGGDA